MASFALSILQNAAKIASEAHVHRAYVSQLERGLKTPTLETPFAIAAALEVSPAEVLKRVEERVRHPDRSS